MENVKISTEFIKLDQFLKWTNVVSQGSDAKSLICSGLIKVNDEIEVRRGRKLRIGDIIEVNSKKFQIV
ncbi:RNA-binding S4 domain-containing protein [Acetivibrio mesophilus]|uniref:RNA-binding S4 domain-containing protein n=1 Tax=Acetivibrio mesophilus TaxID=2487273 RepID=A0A4Q0I134_9FIRM|nr:RNA-binding S4 domain-containing protein [Acetivibrio mesophilus]ODM27148.1 RNA-binding protein [Clostridium sp. Bc-iso-3]RXE57813.1 RNA-binding S4 domain-containing protein [Acetivibrio mesophilus]HHV28532.1 RNA-binding S4 domain-containing protein [Clostridium sp.]